MGNRLVRSTILLLGVVAALLAAAWWIERGERARAPLVAVITPRHAAQKPGDPIGPAGAASLTEDEWHSWDISKDGDHKVYRADGVTVTLSKGRDSDGDPAPRISVESADGRKGEATGQPWSADIVRADFGVGRIDPRNRTSEVVFATYTGGAHCCTDVKILELTKPGWAVLELGEYDGDTPLFPKDANGTSTPAFVLRDDRFLYAFASHADSWSPPVVYVIDGAKLVDMSASGKYRALYETDLKDAEADCLKHQNGACAAYVADAARLGRFEEAWARMLKSYDKTDTWELPTDCDAAENKSGECPKGHEHKFDNYPDSLRAFLARNGYIANGKR